MKKHELANPLESSSQHIDGNGTGLIDLCSLSSVITRFVQQGAQTANRGSSQSAFLKIYKLLKI